MDEALGQVQAFAIIAAGLGLTPMVAATPSWPISEAGEGVGWGRCMAGAWRGCQGVSGRLEGGRVPAQGARSMMCIPCYPRDLLGGAHRPGFENFFGDP